VSKRKEKLGGQLLEKLLVDDGHRTATLELTVTSDLWEGGRMIGSGE